MEITELGCAGHLIVANRCQWKRHTQVGKYRISSIGNYYLETKKFQAFNEVVVTNPEQVLESENLDYFTESGKAYLNKASTITGKESVVYTERGFHDSKAKVVFCYMNQVVACCPPIFFFKSECCQVFSSNFIIKIAS